MVSFVCVCTTHLLLLPQLFLFVLYTLQTLQKPRLYFWRAIAFISFPGPTTRRNLFSEFVASKFKKNNVRRLLRAGTRWALISFFRWKEERSRRRRVVCDSRYSRFVTSHLLLFPLGFFLFFFFLYLQLTINSMGINSGVSACSGKDGLWVTYTSEA